MKIITHLWVVLFCFFMTSVGQAQELNKVTPSGKVVSASDRFESSKHESMKSDDIIKIKKEYFKKHLTLSDNEDPFWSMFDHYLQEERRIHQQCKMNQEEYGIKREEGKIDFASLDEEQILFYFENKLEMRSSMLELDRNFHEKLKSVLSPKTILQYYKVEKDFKNYVSGAKKFTEQKGSEKLMPSRDLKN